jgi:hypothetical protein
MTIHTDPIALATDLKKFAHTMEVDYAVALKKIAFDALAFADLRTPIDHGRAAGSWGISRNSPGESVHPEGFESASPRGDNFVEVAGPGTAFDTYWIWNNVEYIAVLDQGLFPGSGPKTTGGYSTQAPAGIIEPVFADLEASILEALNNVL